MTKRKYFLVVAASKTSGTVNNLPFTKVDAQGVSKALTERGYESSMFWTTSEQRAITL